MTTSGTLIRKATRQLIDWISRPPRVGPRIVVAEVAAAQIPNARLRAGSTNVAVMIDSEQGTRSAPAAPWSTRNTTSSSRLGDSPHRIEVRPKPARPIMKTRRRP